MNEPNDVLSVESERQTGNRMKKRTYPITSILMDKVEWEEYSFDKEHSIISIRSKETYFDIVVRPCYVIITSLDINFMDTFTHTFIYQILGLML